jgi:hypothetical protein
MSCVDDPLHARRIASSAARRVPPLYAPRRDNDPDPSATKKQWACDLIDYSGLAAATLALRYEEQQFLPPDPGDTSVDRQTGLQCCSSICETQDCASIDRLGGRGARTIECGACPSTEVYTKRGCGPSNPQWATLIEADRRADYEGPRLFDMTVCRAMTVANATNAVHIHYFLEQQQAARQLLVDAGARLGCPLCVGRCWLARC